MLHNNNFSDRISYDNKGFIINGKRTFLISGSIHYFRVPRQLWADRFEKARHFGLNCIETYVAWNVHEPEEGIFSFEGQNDLESFLDMAHSYGFYVICRPGPYICAEWDFGGFPSWFLQKKGLKPRRINGPYLQYVGRWFDVLLPKLRDRLITRDGPILMVQVENELANLELGEAYDHLYMQQLVPMFTRNDIDVPLISCEGGLEGALECINAFDPSERYTEYRQKYPDSPLMSTEFWSSWYHTWNRLELEYPRTPEFVQKATWNVLAQGGAGYNYYMWHGGTNFGYNSMHLQTTSYFNEAPLNETGGFSPCGIATRRVAWFSRAMNETLAASESQLLVGRTIDLKTKGMSYTMELPDEVKDFHCWERSSDKGKLLFLDNNGNDTQTVTWKMGTRSLSSVVPAHSVRPIIVDLPLQDGVALEFSTVNLCAIERVGSQEWIVVYGEAGETGWLVLRGVEHAENGLPAGIQLVQEQHQSIAVITFQEEPQVWNIQQNAQTIRILALSTELCDSTWFGKDELIIGPRQPITEDKVSKWWLGQTGSPKYRLDNSGLNRLEPLHVEPAVTLPALADWHTANAVPEAAVDYDDMDWAISWEPEEMTQLDCHYGYGWYRTRVTSAHQRQATLFFEAYADRFLLFVNNELIGVAPTTPEQRTGHPAWGIQVNLQQGDNVIAVLVDNLGKIKSDRMLGMVSMDNEAKGLFGPVRINWDVKESVNSWKFRSALCVESPLDVQPQWSGEKAAKLDWLPLRGSSNKACTLNRSRFTLNTDDLNQYEHLRVDLTGMTKGNLWVNGVHLGRYWTINGMTDYYIPHTILQKVNELVLFEEFQGDISLVRLKRDAMFTSEYIIEV